MTDTQPTEPSSKDPSKPDTPPKEGEMKPVDTEAQEDAGKDRAENRGYD